MREGGPPSETRRLRVRPAARGTVPGLVLGGLALLAASGAPPALAHPAGPELPAPAGGFPAGLAVGLLAAGATALLARAGARRAAALALALSVLVLLGESATHAAHHLGAPQDARGCQVLGLTQQLVAEEAGPATLAMLSPAPAGDALAWTADRAGPPPARLRPARGPPAAVPSLA